jgi:hypothetical protein
MITHEPGIMFLTDLLGKGSIEETQLIRTNAGQRAAGAR